jgi:hypothetical protein
MRTKPLLSLGILTAALSLSLASCGGDPGGPACTAIYAYGLNVTVRDDVTNLPICDAILTATDGAYSEVLQSQSAGGGDCTYVGAG